MKKIKIKSLYLCVIFSEFFFFTFNESGVWQHQNIMNYCEMFQQLRKKSQRMVRW